MTKQEFLTRVMAKEGFVSIIDDKTAPDSPQSTIGVKEKRYLLIETINTNGTAGQVALFYIHDMQADVVRFYGVEPVSLASDYDTEDTKVYRLISNYCKNTFTAYFIIPDRVDVLNKWAVVEAYTESAGKLARRSVLVFKKGINPVTHIDII
jgi:hypothetical protein